MSYCPFCGCVYDESEYTHCPRCRDGRVMKTNKTMKRIKYVKRK